MIKDLIKFGRFVFLWGIVPATVLALAAALYLRPRVDEEIRLAVERRFSRCYPGLTVTVRSAVRVEGRGIEIRGLSILEPGTNDADAAGLRIEQILLSCGTDLVDLACDDVSVCHVLVRRPNLRLVRLADGTWGGRRLWPPPKFGGPLPTTVIEDGVVEIVDLSKNPPSALPFRDLNLTAENEPRPAGAPPGPPTRVVRGSLTGSHFGRIDLAGRGDPERLDWEVSGTVRDLRITPELRAALPGPLAEQLALPAGFRGRAELEFTASADAALASGCRFGVTGRIAEGRLDDPRLPDPWTNVRGTIHVNNAGLAVEDLTAQGGRTTLWVSRGRCGFGSPSPWFVSARVTQLTLDARLRAFLPPPMQELWDKYRPAGEVDAVAELYSDGRQLDLAHSRATVECKGVAFAYHKFPYPVAHAQGTLAIENDVLTIRLTARAGDRPVTMSGELRQPLDAPHGWFEASGRDLPIDERLRAALDERARHTFELLSPGGRGDFWFRAWRERATDECSRQVVLDLKDGTICYRLFPYPLEKVHGRLERLADGTWEFRDLRGVNDTAEIACSGRLADGPQGKQLSLFLTGKNVPLDMDLHKALKPSMRQAWDNLDPRGVIDLKEASISWWVDSKRLDLVVVAQPQPKTTSIKPSIFPYQMEEIEGTLVYRDGHVTVDRFRGVHGRTSIAGRGVMSFEPDGSWDVHLKDVCVDRLQFDERDLVQAMPGRLREGLAKLNASGDMYLRDSTLDVHHSGVAGEPPRTAWNVRLGLQPGRLCCGVCLENIRGELSMSGQSDGKSYHARGELLDIESLSYKNLQFTEVRGPFWIDDGRVLLGTWVGRRAQNADGTPIEPPRALTAKLFGGTVTADAWVAPRNVPCYALQAELIGADLARFATETMAGRQDLKGRVGLRLNLEGRQPTVNGLRGSGQMWLRDGDVYKLPVMVSILKILSWREPDATAFSAADVLFQIAGDHVYLSQIEFNGDAISLVGQGELDFQSNVDLAFHAVVGRNKWKLPVISPLMGQASEQMMTIKVRGPLRNPEASRDVLPVVKEALRELDDSLRASPNGPPGDAPQWPAAGRTQPDVAPRSLRR